MLIYACLFITLLASGRNKPVHLELLSFSWNSAEIQKCMLKCPMCFLKVYSSISPNSSWVSSLWQTFKPDTELRRACLREASISSSRLQLFDLVSEETGKKEGKMKNERYGPLQQVSQACVFFSRSADFSCGNKKLYQPHSIQWEFDNPTWVDDAFPLLRRTATGELGSPLWVLQGANVAPT